MGSILITGAAGFLGRNLAAHLAARDGLRLLFHDVNNSEVELRAALAEADVIFHLAGVNRPQNVEEFEAGNATFTAHLCQLLRDLGRTPQIILTSSTQALLDNPYGVSKRHAEQLLGQFSAETGGACGDFPPEKRLWQVVPAQL